MADISTTAANVVTSSGTTTADYAAGEAFTAGQCVYLKASDSRWYKMQADGTAAEAGSGGAFGFALSTGVVAQPVTVQTSGIVNLGATLVVGAIYVVSAAAGSVAPTADITTTGYYRTVLGFASTAALLDMSIKKYMGVALP